MQFCFNFSTVINCIDVIWKYVYARRTQLISTLVPHGISLPLFTLLSALDAIKFTMILQELLITTVTMEWIYSQSTRSCYKCSFELKKISFSYLLNVYILTVKLAPVLLQMNCWVSGMEKCILMLSISVVLYLSCSATLCLCPPNRKQRIYAIKAVDNSSWISQMEVLWTPNPNVIGLNQT